MARTNVRRGRPYGSRDSREREYQPPPPLNGEGKVRFTGMVDPEIHRQAHDNAKACGVTAGRYIAELIARDVLDQDGRPVWADDAFGPRDELPLGA